MCEMSIEENLLKIFGGEKYVDDFINYLNSLPNAESRLVAFLQYLVIMLEHIADVQKEAELENLIARI